LASSLRFFVSCKKREEIGLIGLVAWFGSLPLLRSSAAAAAPNPQQESKPNQTKPIHSFAASAAAPINSQFLFPF